MATGRPRQPTAAARTVPIRYHPGRHSTALSSFLGFRARSAGQLGHTLAVGPSPNLCGRYHYTRSKLQRRRRWRWWQLQAQPVAGEQFCSAERRQSRALKPNSPGDAAIGAGPCLQCPSMPGRRHAQLSGFFVGLPPGVSVWAAQCASPARAVRPPPDAAEKGEPATLLLWAKGGQGCAARVLIGRTPLGDAGRGTQTYLPELSTWAQTFFAIRRSPGTHTHPPRHVCVAVAVWLAALGLLPRPGPTLLASSSLFPPPKQQQRDHIHHLTLHQESHLLSQKIIAAALPFLPATLLPGKPRLSAKSCLIRTFAAHCFGPW